jgi:hypothetical protein
MPGLWKAWKAKSRFSTIPPPRGNIGKTNEKPRRAGFAVAMAGERQQAEPFLGFRQLVAVTDQAPVLGGGLGARQEAGARTGVGEHFKRPRGELHPMVFGRQQAGEKTEDEEARIPMCRSLILNIRLLFE